MSENVMSKLYMSLVALNIICSTVHVLYQYNIIVVSWALAWEPRVHSKVIGWLGIFLFLLVEVSCLKLPPFRGMMNR